jgi:hypothetical protein
MSKFTTTFNQSINRSIVRYIYFLDFLVFLVLGVQLFLWGCWTW